MDQFRCSSLYIVILLFSILHAYGFIEHGIIDFSNVAETSNYTCQELIRWLGTEKHYSNDKKNVLFGLLLANDINCPSHQSSVVLSDVSFGANDGKMTFFYNKKNISDKKNDNRNKSYKKCSQHA